MTFIAGLNQALQVTLLNHLMNSLAVHIPVLHHIPDSVGQSEFYHSGVMINLDDDNDDNYPPFALFREVVYQTFGKMGLPQAVQKQMLVTMWAMVHGITSLLTNKNIQYSGNWAALMDNNPLLKGDRS